MIPYIIKIYDDNFVELEYNGKKVAITNPTLEENLERVKEIILEEENFDNE